MAKDESNPFDRFLEEPDPNIQAPNSKFNEALPRPLDAWERFVVKYIFENQPARGAQYLKERGFEVNPKDNNQYRVAGKEKYAEVDPGGILNFGEHIREGKPAKSDMVNDIVEFAADFVEGSITELAADIAGGISTIAGTAGTGGAGVIPAAGAGLAVRSGVRMAAFNLFEGAKDQIGDLLLEQDIPVDQRLRAVQSLMTAAAPAVIEKATPFIKSGISSSKTGQLINKAVASAAEAPAKLYQKAVKGLIKLGVTDLDDATLDRLARDLPTNPKATQEAAESIQRRVMDFMGMESGASKSSYSIFKTEFGKKITSLEGAKKAALSRIDDQGASTIDIKEAKKPFQNLLLKIDSMLSDDSERKAAKAFIAQSVDEIDRLGRNNKLTLGNIDSFVNARQKQLFNGPQSDWKRVANEAIAGVANPEEGVTDGINTILKNRINKLDPAKVMDPETGEMVSNYVLSNKQQSKVYDLYDRAKNVLTPKNATDTVFVGAKSQNKTLAQAGVQRTSSPNLSKQLQFDDVLAETDALLGSNLGKELQTNQMRNQFFKYLENEKRKGIVTGIRGQGTRAALASSRAVTAAGERAPMASALQPARDLINVGASNQPPSVEDMQEFLATQEAEAAGAPQGNAPQAQAPQAAPIEIDPDNPFDKFLQ